MSDRDRREYSKVLLDGDEKTPARAMLRATGFSDQDFHKPQIGVASTWSMVTPCNMHIHDLADCTVKGIDSAGGKAVMFNTITVSDGISMGSPAMRYSLVSREVIADSIETVAAGAGFDGLVALGGCDKNMPGCLIALARLNRPSVFIYGGTIMPGEGRTDIVSVFEAVGAHAVGNINRSDLIHIEKTAIPGPGSCGGMYTANTMASAIEALGMSLPGSSAQTAISDDKRTDALKAGEAVLNLVKLGIRPSDIMTRNAFENAIRVVIALGGSTNAVLHLLAMAHATGVDLSLKDFADIGREMPVLADLRPSGHYMMSELVDINGIRPLMKRMLDHALLHGDCITVTGKTLAEDLEGVADYPEDQQIIRDFDRPVQKSSHLAILYGNLASEGCVAKITGKEGRQFTGTARVFESEEAALAAILDETVVEGDVVVIRYEGPKGGPGMREMLSPTSAIMGRGIGDKVALITDGRFSGGSHGFVVGHITPEAAEGGLLAIVEDGDEIVIDAVNLTITLNVEEAVIDSRRAQFTKPEPKENRGVLAKYARQVSSASLGAITD